MIFSGPMVRALFAGTKTQTRRKVRFPGWACGVFTDPLKIEIETDEAGHDPEVICEETGCLATLPLPYRVGDRVWVREAHNFRGARYNDGTEDDSRWSDEEWFRVYGEGPMDAWDPDFPPGWEPSGATLVREMTEPGEDEGPDVRGLITARRSPIHMPRWASRLTLTVTDVRVERLNSISESDAIAEGLVKLKATGRYVITKGDQYLGFAHRDHRVIYETLWNSLHGPGAWDANPWVAALTFSVEPRNIDAQVLP